MKLKIHMIDQSAESDFENEIEVELNRGSMDFDAQVKFFDGLVRLVEECARPEL